MESMLTWLFEAKEYRLESNDANVIDKHVEEPGRRW